MARNYFADPMQTGEEAFDRAFDRQQGITNRITTTRAGRQLAGGDRAGAGRTFAGAGMINEARVLEGDQVAADTRMRQDREREAAGMKARDAEEAQAKAAQAEAMVAILGRLANVPAGQRKATFDRAMPILQNVGFTPDVLGQFGAMTEDDFTDEALQMATGEAAKAAEEYTLAPGARRYQGDKMIAENPARPIVMGGGASAFDPATGEVVARNPKTFAPPRPGGGAGLPPPPSGWRPAGQ
jgi:hypothetical protein